MTQAILRGLAMQALNMVKTECLQRRFGGFLVAAYTEGEPLHRLKMLEQKIPEVLGKDWLNNGRAKDAGFDLIRNMCKVLPPDAMVFVNAANMFKETPKMRALPEEQRAAMIDRGHDYHHQLVKEGMLELVDSMVATAQSPEHVVICVQKVDKDKFVGQAEFTMEGPQSHYHGRTKMYDDEPVDPEFVLMLLRAERRKK